MSVKLETLALGDVSVAAQARSVPTSRVRVAIRWFAAARSFLSCVVVEARIAVAATRDAYRTHAARARQGRSRFCSGMATP